MTTESHVLLNKGEFVEACSELGHDLRTSGRVFNTLVRTGIYGFFDENIDDIAEPNSESPTDVEFSDIAPVVALFFDQDRPLGEFLTGLLERWTNGVDPDLEDDSTSQTEPKLRQRQSNDIAYRELNMQGIEEAVVSLPNLASQLERISKIHGIGEKSVAICKQILTAYKL
jgi:hypothetical protein